MSSILEVGDWEDCDGDDDDASGSIESDEREINNVEERQLHKAEDAHADAKFDEIVTEHKATVSTGNTTDNSGIALTPGNNPRATEHSALDLQAKAQMRIFRQLVGALNAHLNQEITISLVTPLLTYLVAEVS